jgi:hypothetical protein
MCKFIKHIHTACSHSDNDGRKHNAELGFVRYCEQALEEADMNNEKTKLCGGMKVEDLPAEWENLKGMCRECFEGNGKGECGSVEGMEW